MHPHDDDGALPVVLRDPLLRVPMWFRACLLGIAAAGTIYFLITDTGPARWFAFSDVRFQWLLTLLFCLAAMVCVMFLASRVWPPDPREPKPPPVARIHRR